MVRNAYRLNCRTKRVLIGELMALGQRASPIPDDRGSSIAYLDDFEGGKKVLFSLRPVQSNAEAGLHFQIYLSRMAQHLGIPEDQLLKALPEEKEPWSFYEGGGPDYSGFEGFFADKASADKFLTLLNGGQPQMVSQQIAS